MNKNPLGWKSLFISGGLLIKSSTLHPSIHWSDSIDQAIQITDLPFPVPHLILHQQDLELLETETKTRKPSPKQSPKMKQMDLLLSQPFPL